jgi:hypothetical protein
VKKKIKKYLRMKLKKNELKTGGGPSEFEGTF